MSKGRQDSSQAPGDRSPQMKGTGGAGAGGGRNWNGRIGAGGRGDRRRAQPAGHSRWAGHQRVAVPGAQPRAVTA